MAAEPDQHVEGERHQLETEEDGDQVVRRRHHDHAERRAEQQRVVLGVVDRHALDVVPRQEHADHTDGAEQQREEHGDAVVQEHAVEQRAPLVAHHPHAGRSTHEHEQRDHRPAIAPRSVRQELEQEQEQDARAEHQRRPQRPPVHRQQRRHGERAHGRLVDTGWSASATRGPAAEPSGRCWTRAPAPGRACGRATAACGRGTAAGRRPSRRSGSGSARTPGARAA